MSANNPVVIVGDVCLWPAKELNVGGGGTHDCACPLCGLARSQNPCLFPLLAFKRAVQWASHRLMKHLSGVQSKYKTKL